ncbi:MAG: hypothetical protein H6707_11910 [Deltaproteobacteria bacterium]|nr:hypothetical protein [Deltaproteobacteria bacterium]
MSDAKNSSQEEHPDPRSEQQAQISLDHYMSRRRPPLRSRLSLIGSVVLMTVALLLIFIYQNRCSSMVANVFTNAADQQPGAPKKTTTPSR